ncbi:MAG: TSUP family transporter, partial [Bacteroidetes bacterium]|nr:TSUP family transporter [Bacteroidota bacterium]
VFTGILAGIVSGLSGLGGGVITVPVLNQSGINIKKASSISLGAIPIFAMAMSGFYLLGHSPQIDLEHSMGYICFDVSLPLAIGVVLAAPMGGIFAKKLPEPLIKVIFAILLVVVALKLIYTNLL